VQQSTGLAAIPPVRGSRPFGRHRNRREWLRDCWIADRELKDGTCPVSGHSGCPTTPCS